MTILEALQSINSFPIPNNTLEVICLDRELISTEEYTKAIGISEGYELATADVYLYLYGSYDVKEQEVSLSQAAAIKEGFLKLANKIYKKYDDPKFTGGVYGFIGEGYN